VLTNPASSPSTNRPRSSAKTGALSKQVIEATIAKGFIFLVPLPGFYRPPILMVFLSDWRLWGDKFKHF
jgi:hypothetical protein